MIHSAISRRSRLPAGAAVLLLLLAGCASPDANDTDNGNPAESPITLSAPAEASASPTPDTVEQAEQALVMEASTPVSLAIPTLERTGEIIETGLREDNTLEVPPDHEGAPASWYTGSPTPGQAGPSVLLGHVNSTEDESGVFYNLEALQNGDQIKVTRKDGSTAVFEVYKSELYPKNNFPTKAVYFPVEEAELRLITCDGFTESTGEFVDNLVIYATLVDTE
ncbi:Sortase family protein [Arthrobacter subterraneus]|uniref:Sortase family protein n=1 Tax=Arthrobacter subterraneus TaxID=335973 RepID=A0A1G8P4B8_9MICC|nr:class F sortase [Arthrobacter subterraneus]SDI87343.1 Sortase family protein [Arthrobacter subterraneus]